MTFTHVTGPVLERAREDAKVLMTLDLDHQRPTGETTIDPVTLEETPELAAVGETVGRLAAPEGQTQIEPVAGAEIDEDHYRLSVPYDYPETVKRHDLFTVSTAGRHQGRSFEVVGEHHGDQITARRMTVVEVT